MHSLWLEWILQLLELFMIRIHASSNLYAQWLLYLFAKVAFRQSFQIKKNVFLFGTNHRGHMPFCSIPSTLWRVPCAIEHLAWNLHMTAFDHGSIYSAEKISINIEKSLLQFLQSNFLCAKTCALCMGFTIAAVLFVLLLPRISFLFFVQLIEIISTNRLFEWNLMHPNQPRWPATHFA